MAKQRINLYYDEAHAALDRVGMSDERKAELRAFADELLNRDR